MTQWHPVYMTFSLISGRISHHRGKYHKKYRSVKGRITFSSLYLRFIENDSSKSDQPWRARALEMNRTRPNAVWAKNLVSECCHPFLQPGEIILSRNFCRILPEKSVQLFNKSIVGNSFVRDIVPTVASWLF